MKILLKSDICVVRGFTRTGAEFFKDIKVGDELQFSTPLKSPGRGRGLYATYVEVKNLTQNTKTSRSLSCMVNQLKKLDLINIEAITYDME